MSYKNVRNVVDLPPYSQDIWYSVIVADKSPKDMSKAVGVMLMPNDEVYQEFGTLFNLLRGDARLRDVRYKTSKSEFCIEASVLDSLVREKKVSSGVLEYIKKNFELSPNDIIAIREVE